VRFATFNFEDLFARPKVFNLATWAEGEPILKSFAEFNALIERVNYTDANKARMTELLLVLEVIGSTTESSGVTASATPSGPGCAQIGGRSTSSMRTPALRSWPTAASPGPELGGHFEHVMLIDGNDTRRIDVGIMTSKDVEIVSMHSNVDVPDPGAPGERLFSRDCAEYLCRLPNKRSDRAETPARVRPSCRP